MDYEALYTELARLEKETEDHLKLLQDTLKAAKKATDAGNLKQLKNNVDVLASASEEQAQCASAIKAKLEAYDNEAFFQSGDFAAKLLEACAERHIDVTGDAPVFDMFPCRLRIDAANQEVYLNRKKIPCARPAALTEIIAANNAKLMKASFNAEVFADELAEAYDVTRLKNGKPEASDIYLNAIYKNLVPMSRSRKEYDLQEFAFNLMKLYVAHVDSTKKGRRFVFGPSRNGSKAMRVIDPNGNEIFLTTICFY